MADQPAPSSNSGPGTAASLLLFVATAAATLISKLWSGLTRDGTLAAAGRQGAAEISQALKAFPDAVSAQETGTVLNPLSSELAAGTGNQLGGAAGSRFYSASSSSLPPHPWPSELAQQHKHQPSPAQSHGHSHDAGLSL